MKSQVEARRRQRSCLRLEVLEPVLADQLDAGLGERAHLVRRRRTWSRPGSRRPRPRARAPARGCARTTSGSMPRISSAICSHATPAWRPVSPPSRRWEKNRSGLQLVQRPRALDLARRRPRPSSRVATSGRSSIRPSASPSPEGVERRQDLVPDLEAAAADAGADRRGASASTSRDSARRRCPPRARASRSGASRRRPGPLSATGRQSATKTSGARPGPAVAWPSTSGGSAGGRRYGVGRGGAARGARPRRRGPGGR